jgi:hypothetical protein
MSHSVQKLRLAKTSNGSRTDGYLFSSNLAIPKKLAVKHALD